MHIRRDVSMLLFPAARTDDSAARLVAKRARQTILCMDDFLSGALKPRQALVPGCQGSRPANPESGQCAFRQDLLELIKVLPVDPARVRVELLAQSGGHPHHLSHQAARAHHAHGA